MMIAKLKEGNIGQDKIPGDVTTPCQCMCHNKRIKVTATASMKPPAFDLTVSPCKDAKQQLPSAAEYSKCVFFGLDYHLNTFIEKVFVFHLYRYSRYIKYENMSVIFNQAVDNGASSTYSLKHWWNFLLDMDFLS